MDCDNKDNNLHERILMLENTVRNLKLKNENDLNVLSAVNVMNYF